MFNNHNQALCWGWFFLFILKQQANLLTLNKIKLGPTSDAAQNFEKLNKNFLLF